MIQATTRAAHDLISDLHTAFIGFQGSRTFCKNAVSKVGVDYRPLGDVQITDNIGFTVERAGSVRKESEVLPLRPHPVVTSALDAYGDRVVSAATKDASRKRRTLVGSPGKDTTDARTARTAAEAKHACARVPTAKARHAGEGVAAKTLYAVGIVDVWVAPTDTFDPETGWLPGWGGGPPRPNIPVPAFWPPKPATPEKVPPPKPCTPSPSFGVPPQIP